METDARVFKEKPESMCVRVAGVRARLTLDRQPLLQESCDVRRD
jgi:hypothetical protein